MGGGVSFTEPIEASTSWTKMLLFSPFNLMRWLVLCVPVFLIQCSSGGGMNFQCGNPFGGFGGGPTGTGMPSMADVANEIDQFMTGNTALVASMVIGLLLLVLVIMAVVSFLGARAQFIFLDNVLTGREGVVEPWSRLATVSNSYWFWDFGLSVLVSVFGLGFVLLGFRDFMGFLRSNGDFTVFLNSALISGGCIYMLVALVIAMLKTLMKDFVVPLMYRREMLFGAALVSVLGLLRANLGTMVLWFLWRIMVWVILMVCIFICTLLLCCISCIPVLNVIPALPFHVWWRTYTVLILEQFGPDWEIFQRDVPQSGWVGGHLIPEPPPSL